LDVAAFWAGDGPKMLAALNAGLARKTIGSLGASGGS